MDSNIPSFFFLLSLTLCLALHPHLIVATRPSPSSSPLITKACSLSPNKNLCSKVLSSEPESPKNNLNDLAFIAFDITSTTAASNIEFISQSVAVLPSDSPVSQAFSTCDEQYESVVNRIDSSISALTDGPNVGKIETSLKEAIKGVETCQNNVKGQMKQLENKNQHLLDLLNNALSVYHVYTQN